MEPNSTCGSLDRSRHKIITDPVLGEKNKIFNNKINLLNKIIKILVTHILMEYLFISLFTFFNTRKHCEMPRCYTGPETELPSITNKTVFQIESNARCFDEHL